MSTHWIYKLQPQRPLWKVFAALLSMTAEGDEIVSPRACNQAAWIVIGITVSSGTGILKETRERSSPARLGIAIGTRAAILSRTEGKGIKRNSPLASTGLPAISWIPGHTECLHLLNRVKVVAKTPLRPWHHSPGWSSRFKASSVQNLLGRLLLGSRYSCGIRGCHP